ncbi:MAG: hypothetical protein ACI8P3_002898 [Saprospiraceae bacterium]|jgi:hypothetical protein
MNLFRLLFDDNWEEKIYFTGIFSDVCILPLEVTNRFTQSRPLLELKK